MIVADISQIKIDDMNDGEPYNIKDTEARAKITSLFTQLQTVEAATHGSEYHKNSIENEGRTYLLEDSELREKFNAFVNALQSLFNGE